MERRIAAQSSFCRGCDCELNRNVDEIIYMYSHRNRGQNIIFCLSCAKLIGELAEGKK